MSRFLESPPMQRRLSFALLLLACCTVVGTPRVLAQAQPTAPNSTAAPASDAQQAVEEPIGNVATVSGSVSVTRSNETTPLKPKDDIYLNDIVQTGANSALGITFIDATTFNLKANTQITIDNYVYQDGGKQNAGVFDVAKGTAAFVAAAVAKTGDMKITTPTATLGIRGTTGLVEVPVGGGTAGVNNVKLYPDADGKVGRIEVNDRSGARLGFLTQGASGFAIRPGMGGARFAAVPLTITPQMIQRDQGFVRQVHSTQTLGRQVVTQQRDFRRANPTFVNPNRPIRQQQPGQRPNGAPGQNRPGQLQHQPGQPNRPGQQQGAPNRQGQQQPGTAPRTGPQQPGATPRAGQPQQPGTTPRTGLPQRGGQLQQPGSPTQPGQPGLPPRTGQMPPSGPPLQPGLPPRAGQPQPGLPAQTGAPPQGQPGFPNRIAPHVPGLSRVPGVQGAPALRPGALPRRAPVVPPKGRLPRDVR
jgi:hypothetical protein